MRLAAGGGKKHSLPQEGCERTVTNFIRAKETSILSHFVI